MTSANGQHRILVRDGLETEFCLPNAFRTQESAIEAAIQAERQIDVAFERAGSRERL